jgi:flagellar basal-body rod protein FlgG
MIRALYTSATGMKAQEAMIDNTANNLANVNTNGFKRSQIDFADLLYVTQRQPGAEVASGQVSPTGVQIGSGVRVAGTTKVFTPGTPALTGNQSDLAIEGDGFFEIDLPDGSKRYTRDGALKLDGQGNLVTSEGYLVSPAVTIPQGVSQFSISQEGLVSGQQDGSPSTTFGQIQLFRFPNSAGLSSEGGNLYAETTASGAAISSQPGQNGTGSILQYHHEQSNVEVVTELISLITAQRAYEINSRAIRAGDEMLSVASEIVR